MWFPFAFLSAVLDAAEKTLTKSTSNRYSDVLIAWVPSVTASVLMLPLLWFTPMLALTVTFWMIVISRGVLDAIARLLLIRSLRHGDISLTFPILSFTPVLLVAIEWVTTGDLPAPLGWLGIGLIVCGIVALQTVGTGRYTWQAIRSHESIVGVGWMFVVATLYAFTSVLHRFGIAESSVALYMVISQVSITVFLSLFGMKYLAASGQALKQVTTYRDLMPIGVLSAIGVGAQLHAQSLTLASYVVATKRSSIVFSALGAAIWLKERVARRLIPILCIFAGIVCLALV